MGTRILVLALVAALSICAAPVYAAKKSMKASEAQTMSSDYAKAVELVNARQWNAGIEAMTKVIDNPKTSKDIMANAYADRGSCYANKKMYDEAMNDFNKALEIKPDLANAHYERARCEAMLGKHAEAVQDLTTVIEMSKSNQPSVVTASYYYNRGISYMGMIPPNPEAAKADFAKAKQINPKLKIPVKYKNL